MIYELSKRCETQLNYGVLAESWDKLTNMPCDELIKLSNYDRYTVSNQDILSCPVYHSSTGEQYTVGGIIFGIFVTIVLTIVFSVHKNERH